MSAKKMEGGEIKETTRGQLKGQRDTTERKKETARGSDLN